MNNLRGLLRPRGGDLRSGRGITKLTKVDAAAEDGSLHLGPVGEAGRVEERLLVIPDFL